MHNNNEHKTSYWQWFGNGKTNVRIRIKRTCWNTRYALNRRQIESPKSTSIFGCCQFKWISNQITKSVNVGIFNLWRASTHNKLIHQVNRYMCISTVPSIHTARDKLVCMCVCVCVFKSNTVIGEIKWIDWFNAMDSLGKHFVIRHYVRTCVFLWVTLC